MPSFQWIMVALACAGVATRAASAQQRPPIIDMHMHAHMPGSDHVPGGAPSLCRPAPCDGAGAASHTAEESLARTLAASGKTAAAREEYTRILEQWKEADEDLRLVQQVRAEAAKLGS